MITIDLSVELTQDQVRELEAAANRYICTKSMSTIPILTIAP